MKERRKKVTMLSLLDSLFGQSEESSGKKTTVTDPDVVVREEETNPLPIADGGKDWNDVRTKTPSSGKREPARSNEVQEQRHRSQLKGVPRGARKKLTSLVEERNFRGMPSGRVRSEWGIKRIGNGNFRNVFGFKSDSKIPMDNPEKYVLKVAGKYEEWTNEEEVKVYCKLQDSGVERYLAPVVDFGPKYKWVLMRRAEVEPHPEPDKVHDMKRKCRDLGWDYGDWKPDNCGRVDGDVVLVDYGYHNDIIDESLIG